ncbi:hypothetical protein IT570_12335 [Candidatus Sumerlaeota bacterium]|nr:hypothetical protein [Candidatus Sumerlaeota bacterium]
MALRQESEARIDEVGLDVNRNAFWIRLCWYVGIAVWILYQAASIDMGGRHQDRDILNALYWIIVGPALLYTCVWAIRRFVRWAMGREPWLLNPRYLVTRITYGTATIILALAATECFMVLLLSRANISGCVLGWMLLCAGLGVAAGWRWRYWSAQAKPRS